jgi:uncharacterized protein
VYLLDVNVLIALAWPQHVHHGVTHSWFTSTGHRAWVTCPLTELGFIRLSSNPRVIPVAVSPRAAAQVLEKITHLPGHHFWSADLSPLGSKIFSSLALVGHRQVTDAYLLALAQQHHSKLATLDQSISALLDTETAPATVIELLSEMI